MQSWPISLDVSECRLVQRPRLADAERQREVSEVSEVSLDNGLPTA